MSNSYYFVPQLLNIYFSEECLEKNLVISGHATQFDNTEVKIYADNQREDRDGTMVTEDVVYHGSGDTSCKCAQPNIQDLHLNSSGGESDPKEMKNQMDENDIECGSDDEKAEHEGKSREHTV